MGIDGSDYSCGGKRGVGFGGYVCRAGFLCETALGDFRVGDATENGTRQSRAPLREVAGTRAPAERPASLDFTSSSPLLQRNQCRKIDSRCRRSRFIDQLFGGRFQFCPSRERIGGRKEDV